MPPECHGEAVANAQGNILGLTDRVASITSLDGIIMRARMSENCGHFAVEKKRGDQQEVNIAYRTRTQRTRPRQQRKEGASFSGELVKMNVEGSRECGQMNANARPQRVGREGREETTAAGGTRNWFGEQLGGRLGFYMDGYSMVRCITRLLSYSVILHVLGPALY